MLAKRADEILGQLIADIFITADGATPNDLIRLFFFLGLRFYIFMIVFIGYGRRVGERVHIGYLSDKQSVRTAINGARLFNTDICVRACGDIHSSV